MNTEPETFFSPDYATARERFRAAAQAAGVRYLNLENLSKALRQAVASLKEGQTPAQLGLGELTREACEKLLLLLHIQWCAAGTGRMDERSPVEIRVMISSTIPAIHFHLTGRAFRQPGGEITARERRDLDVLGNISDRNEQGLASQRSASIDIWAIVNKSASGFLGLCRDPRSATCVSHNQLVGLQSPATKTMYLGIVQRLIVDEEGATWAGLRLIPGAPRAAAVCVAGADARAPNAAKYDRALLVPKDTARNVPSSVLLLPTWYLADRVIDLQTDKAHKLRLQALLDKGPNFERATFTAV